MHHRFALLLILALVVLAGVEHVQAEGWNALDLKTYPPIRQKAASFNVGIGNQYGRLEVGGGGYGRPYLDNGRYRGKYYTPTFYLGSGGVSFFHRTVSVPPPSFYPY